MTKHLILTILMVSLVSIPALAEFSLELELYPNRMDDLSFQGNWLKADSEWFATTINFNKELIKGLNLGFEVRTYLFATTGLSYAPSSVKFTNWISYTYKGLTIKFQHYCWHYFHQFENNYSDQDKLTLEYSF